MKTCNVCKNTKDKIFFHKNSDYKDGYRNTCKDCTREKNGVKKRENKNKTTLAKELFIENSYLSLNDFIKICKEKFGLAESTLRVLWYSAVHEKKEMVETNEDRMVKRKRGKFYFDDSRLWL